MKKQLYVEMVKVWNGSTPLISTARKATKNEINEGQRVYKQTRQCKHPVFYDTAGWMYDDRWCGICNKHIGFI